MMRLAAVVHASARAAQTAGRLAKRDAIQIAGAYLSGETRQGKLGIGYATLSELRGGPLSAEPSLTLHVVGDSLARVAATTGK